MSEFDEKPIRGRGRRTDRTIRATRLRCHPGVEALERLLLLAAPVAADDVYGTPEDTPLVVAAPGVLANDTDADGDPLTAILVSGPTSGSLTFNADGSFTYTPAANFNGADGFTYRANDGTANGNTATVTLTIAAVNDAPMATADAATVTEDSASNPVNVLANDTDADGEVPTITAVTQGANGSVTFTPAGASYTPDPNDFGEDSFTYTIDDGNGGTDTATVNVTVTAVDEATTTTLTTSPNPSVVGQSVTLTATVAAPGGATTPTGTVSFFDGGPFLGTATLSAGGIATLTTSTLSVGTHSITAVYNGDAEFLASSSPMPVSQRVVASQATTTLTLPVGQPVADQPVTFRASVAGTAGTGTPTGSVNFFDGTTNLGAGSLDANGVATLTITGLSAGTHALSAAYGGDATHAASTSPVASLEVEAATRVTRLQRFGFFTQPTTLVLTFSRPLDPVSAQDPSNYLLVGPLGRAGLGGRAIAVTRSVYDPAARTVTLSLARRLPLLNQFRLSLRPGAGRPDYSTTFGGRILAGRARTSGSFRASSPIVSRGLSPQAVDQLLALEGVRPRIGASGR